MLSLAQNTVELGNTAFETEGTSHVSLADHNLGRYQGKTPYSFCI